MLGYRTLKIYSTRTNHEYMKPFSLIDSSSEHLAPRKSAQNGNGKWIIDRKVSIFYDKFPASASGKLRPTTDKRFTTATGDRWLSARKKTAALSITLCNAL
ncbi:hypothetical protein [Chlorobaculum thiosulfatiphilum]|jgi:hypothetical protein|uniref:hypothetical protein n=1 Tax=Chlorobaculum thiosulfatiphilum TaxID=115852 RepID=UPI001476CB7F|nr:hypothetical protein [Chlorobaculum thiosulfatiphilum]